MEHFHQANQYFIDEDYELAIEVTKIALYPYL